MKYLIFGIVLFWLLAAAVAADQTDSRLDPLFEQLRTTTSSSQAQAIEARIWAIWYQSGDPQVQKLMLKGVSMMHRGSLRDALVEFTDVTELAPGYAEGWNQRATTYYLMKRYRKALDDIKKVLALAPRHFGALSGRGLCLEAIGRPLDAIKAFRAALKINPHEEQIKEEIIRIHSGMS